MDAKQKMHSNETAGDLHLTESMTLQIETREVTRTTHPELFAHLQESCCQCESFLEGQSLKDTHDYDLAQDEVDRILQNILDETEPDRLRLAKEAQQAKEKETSGQTGWQSWLTGWRAAMWMTPAIATMALVALWETPSPSPTTTTPAPHVQRPVPVQPAPTTKNACGKCAFLDIRVERPQSSTLPPRKLAFQHGGTYQVGDAVLFDFRLLKAGYLTLLRKDASGSLETLFPFGGKGNAHIKQAKTFTLSMNGKRVAYFLEASHVGSQTFYLVLSEKPVSFPSKMSELSNEQRQLIAESDHLGLQVMSKRHR